MASHHWNMEMNHLLVRIERETEQSIKKLRRSLSQCGLSFDQKFRRFFLRATDNRLSETFDRFEIETLEENRNGRGHSHGHDRLRRQSVRDRNRRSVSHTHSHGHNQSYNNSRSCRTTPVVNRSHHHRASSQERRSFSRHERSRSRSAQVQSRQNVRKSSVKDRLGTPVKRPSKPRLPWSPQPSTSQQQPSLPPQQQHHDTEQHSFNENEAQALDELDGTADESQEAFDMSDLNSILSKCISKPSKTASSSIGDLMFACIYCQNDDNYPNARSHDIEDVYAHWLSGHTDLSGTIQPFAFVVNDHNTACFYCDDKIGTLQQTLAHQKECHRNRSIAIVNPMLRNECAFCTYSDSTWLDHFELDHKMLLENDSVNPILLTDDILLELLAIDIHKARQCALCSESFETQHQFDDHSAREHPEQQQEGNVAQIVDTTSIKMYLICDVCQEHIEPDAFLSHLEEHSYQFACTKCDFSTDDLVNLAFHDNQTHQCYSLNFHCLQFSDRLQRHYFHTKAVFGNGLRLTKHNLLNTNYNDYNEFRYMIETMIDIKVKKFNWLMRAHQLRHTGNDLDWMSDADNANMNDDDDDEDMCSVSTNDCLLSTMASSHDQLSPPNATATPNRKARRAQLAHTQLNNPNYLRELKKQLRLLKNICIHGIPRREDENLRDIVIRVFARLGAQVSSNEINAVHRISKSDPLIIVKFQKMSAKQRVMVNRRNKVVLTHDVIDIPDDVMPSKVHIFAQLTNYFEEMRKMAKQFMKHRRLIAYSLTQNGFLVKRTNGGADKLVCSRDELRSYAMKSMD